MLINKVTSKIKYIDFYFSESANQFNECIEFVDLGCFPQRGSVYGYTTWNNIIPPREAYGLFVGDKPDLDKIINSKIDNNITETDLLFFDQNCKYPRFKLATKDMKRTIKLNKADKVVISKYTPSFFTTGFSYLKTDILLVYSPSEDTYYYLNGKKDPRWDKTTYRSLGKFNSIWNNYLFINNDPSLYDILMYLNILPSDTTVISDKVWLLTEHDYKHIDNITNNYMRLIYDTELDKFISNGLEQLQDEDLQTLNTMLTSKDDSVVGMGMKLLSSYDISSAPCAIAIMIKQNWNSLRYRSVKTSVGFQQVLTSLNLSDHILDRENMLHIINRAFSTCGTDESKEKARNAVVNMVFEDGKKFLTDKCEELKDFDLNFDLKVY